MSRVTPAPVSPEVPRIMWRPTIAWVAPVLLAGFVGAFALYPPEWDAAVIRFVDGYVRARPALDYAMRGLTTISLLQGVPLVAAIWWLWVGRTEADRSRLVAGGAAAAVAALASRFLQIVLPSHPRPLHDAALNLVLPLEVKPSDFNAYHSFPSDHASLLFALAATILLVNRRWGVVALLWAALTGFARVYEMVHFPSDVLGGALLGLLAVRLADTPPVLRPAGRLLALGRSAAPAFCAAAFVGSYLLATMFDDVRAIGSGLLRALTAHATG